MIFYDMEVFREDWLGHFIDIQNRKTYTIVNDSKELSDLYNENKDRIWVGYNNKHYDQFIFKGILLEIDPWEINNWIINLKQSGWKFSDAFWEIPMINYDLFSGFHGLKQLEAFMGHDIRETTVDFTIDRKLTDKELEEVINYCKYDVEQTIEVFMRRQNDFNTTLDLVKEFNLPFHFMDRTNAQLSAEVLRAVPQTRRDEFDLNFPKELEVDKYKRIVRWYQNPINMDYTKKLETHVFGVPHIFAWGGLHGARDNYIKEGKFVLVDVSSYYPSLMIEYDYISRNVLEPKLFEEIYNERFRLRAKGDTKQEAYKLVLNTTYGCMGYKYNKLYDPLMRNNVCVTGQLFLLDLIEKFEQIRGIELVQSNTDGILLRYSTESQLEQIKQASEEWSKRTRMNLDYDYFYKIIQKDVNNYMAIGEDKSEFVGGYVKDLDDLYYDLPVINKAIREYFINGVNPRDYIYKEDRLIEFQKIVTVSRLYDYAIHNNQRLPEKTLRVFASNDFRDGTALKYRTVDGRPQYAKFANTPEKAFIDNGYIKDKKAPVKLDKEWYIELAENRINQFYGRDVL